MRIKKDAIEVKLSLPGATLRQQRGFGSLPGPVGISGEHFTLAKGVDTTPLFRGLHGDQCQCPHWGYVLEGRLTTTDADGCEESFSKEDLFYWPPGHNVRVDEDAAIIMFSPEHEHALVIAHMKAMAGG